MIFTRNHKLAEVILKDYRLLSIISRFGIKLGFGNQTIAEICEEKNVDESFFLDILNAYANPGYFPDNHLINFKADVVIQYLTNTHSYYLNSKVPHIECSIERILKESNEKNSENIQLIEHFFQEYKSEIEEHFREEEKEVFPYILDLEKALKLKRCSETLLESIRKKPISDYERNHDSLEVKLEDMKNLIIRFLPPLNCLEDSEHLLTELFMLEEDLRDHTRIEEKVLVPKVKLLEQNVLHDYGK